MNAEEFRQISNVSRETFEKLIAYAELLLKWQSKINLVGKNTISDLWGRHMLDSIQLNKWIPNETNTITDFGSGAGFPGLVLAIVCGKTVHLIEASKKKSAFLREAARITQAPVILHEGRIEKQKGWASDVITARAVAPLSRLIEFAKPYMGKNTVCLFLKGARVEEELTDAQKTWKMKVKHYQSVTHPKGVVLSIKDIVYDQHFR